MEKPKTKLNIDPFWIKCTIFVVVDILCLIGIFRINSSMSSTASEIKKLRAETAKVGVGNLEESMKGELSLYKLRSDRLSSFLPNEDKILDFVVKIEDLKKTGSIGGFKFISTDAVKDKLGLLGLAISVETDGSVDLLNQAITKLDELPYLIRPLAVELHKEASGEGTWKMDYTGFLYVEPDFGKNK